MSRFCFWSFSTRLSSVFSMHNAYWSPHCVFFWFDVSMVAFPRRWCLGCLLWRAKWEITTSTVPGIIVPFFACHWSVVLFIIQCTMVKKCFNIMHITNYKHLKSSISKGRLEAGFHSRVYKSIVDHWVQICCQSTTQYSVYSNLHYYQLTWEVGSFIRKHHVGRFEVAKATFLASR